MTIDWFEPVEFADGTQIARVDISYAPGGVKVWPETLPTGFVEDSPYGDPRVDGMVIRNDGFPTLRDWDDAVPMVVQKEHEPAGWGQF